MKRKSCFNSLIPIHFGITIILTMLIISCSVPVLTTSQVSSVTDSSAECGGTITSDGGATVTERGVCWSTAQAPTVSDSKTNNGTGAGSFTSEISGLTPETIYYVRAYATNIAGTGYGTAVSFTTLEMTTGTVTDIDGNVYQTVKIGNQWWMSDNLKVTHYRDGEAITNVTDNSAWSNLSTGAYCSYNNADSNISTYGLLYNWYVVDDSRTIAPAGWHVPTREEYTELENYLIANGYNWDGSTTEDKIGKALASQTGWNSSSEAGNVGNDMSSNNASGFSSLPGGYRNYNNGAFVSIGYRGYWWSATEYSSARAWVRLLRYNNSGVYRVDSSKRNGFSVRLIRD